MSLDYIRRHYKVPAYRGRIITYRGRRARIVGSDQQYLKLRFTGTDRPSRGRFHPTWEINYSPDESCCK